MQFIPNLTIGAMRAPIIFCDATLSLSQTSYETIEPRHIIKEVRGAVYFRQPMNMYDFRKGETDKKDADVVIYIRNNQDFIPLHHHVICYPYRKNGRVVDYWLKVMDTKPYGVRERFLQINTTIETVNDARLIVSGKELQPLRNEQVDFL